MRKPLTEEQRVKRNAYMREWTAKDRLIHPEKHRARNRKWARKNSEKRRAYNATRRAVTKAYNATYRKEHRDDLQIYLQINAPKISARTAAYKATRKEELRQQQREWRAANPEKVKAMLARRYARKKGSTETTLTAEQWAEIKEAFDHRCAYCERQFKRLTQDHITPLSKGGLHIVSNVVPACPSCNSRKQAGPPPKPVNPLLLTIS